MNRDESPGKVSLLGQGEGYARHGENLRAQISVERDQRAHRHQGCAEGTDGDPRYVGQRTLAMSRFEKNSYHDPLDERVNHSADDKGGEQSEGSVAPGILGLGHRREGGFESSIHEDQY